MFFYRLTIIVSDVFITLPLCDVRLSHLSKDYLLTYLLSMHAWIISVIRKAVRVGSIRGRDKLYNVMSETEMSVKTKKGKKYSFIYSIIHFSHTLKRVCLRFV